MAGKIKHNLSKTKLYQTWRNIRQRCNNPKATHYKYYGGKGIKVCNEWENDFLKFYEWSIQNGYKEGLTIDRIDGNGNYEPSNCRWVDYSVQNSNLSSNHFITYRGVTLPVQTWAKKMGFKITTFSERIRRGWGIERAIETKPDKRRKININGEIKTLPQISKELGGCSELVAERIRKGWSMEEAINTPVGINRKGVVQCN